MCIITSLRSCGVGWLRTRCLTGSIYPELRVQTPRASSNLDREKDILGKKHLSAGWERALRHPLLGPRSARRRTPRGGKGRMCKKNSWMISFWKHPEQNDVAPLLPPPCDHITYSFHRVKTGPYSLFFLANKPFLGPLSFYVSQTIKVSEKMKAKGRLGCTD